MTNYYIEKENKIVLFDTDKQKLISTLGFMPQYKGFEIQQTDKEIISRDGVFVFYEDVEAELLQNAKEAKLKEASDKAFEYRDKTGVISFDGRPVAMPLEEGQTTLTVHTELLNQDDMFQRVVGFQQGIFTEDQIYNTKEDIPVYINAQEAQAIYFAIVARAQKLWVEDYMTYRSMIEACTTPEEVNAIIIDYDNVPVIEETPDENTTDNETPEVQEDSDIQEADSGEIEE